jgi:hypothetical protein
MHNENESRLRDEADIRNVMVRYALGLDQRDFDTVASCFTPDARASYSGITLEPGVQHIIDHIHGLVHLHASTHLLGQSAISFDGDVAHAVTPAIACLADARSDNSGTVRIRGLVYDDDLVVHQGQWKISRREHRATWMTEGAFLDPGATSAPQD